MSAKMSVRKLTKAEKAEVISFVIERDQARCILHRDHKDIEVHELLQKSSSCKNSSTVFRKKYMVCVCRECHHRLHRTGEKRIMVELILKEMSRRYNYTYPQKLIDLRFAKEDSMIDMLKQSREERKRLG